MPNVRAKNLSPALPKAFVRRPTLLTALDEGADRTLTLVCAPPGYGKTLLLADWVRASPRVPTAWVSLDEDDDDPRKLWSAVLAALVGCPAVPASSRLHRLVVSRNTVELDFLTDLLDCFEALPSPVRLVLDDAHHLRGDHSLRGLRMLARRRPSAVRLVVASRHDPALPLARLRLEEGLCELRAEQLRFAERESAVLLERCGLRLEPRQTALLHERCGGWVAGLRLAAMSVRDHADPDAFLATFSGDDHPVADYLVGEVLAGLSEDQREVLRRTSIADRVTAEQAVDLCGRDDAVDLLNALERETGMVTRTGTQDVEYRTQELLRSYLIADLHRQDPTMATALHRQAAAWWDSRGRPLEALHHAARAGDPAVIVELLHRRVPELAARGDHPAMLAALEAVGDTRADTDPWLACAAAQLLLGRGNRVAAAAAVRRARATGSVPAGTDIDMLLTSTERLAGGGPRPPRAERLPDDPALAALVLAGRGAATLAAGAVVTARADLELALERARADRLHLLEAQCLCLLGGAAWAAGDYDAAASAGAAGVAVNERIGWSDSGWAAGAHAVAALAALEHARPDRAAESAAAGMRTSVGAGDPVVRFALRIARGGALGDLGDRTTGLHELQHARAELGAAAVPPALAAAAALQEHRLACRLGHAAAAGAAASWLAGRGAGRAEQLLMRGWTESAAGGRPAARATIAALLRSNARPAYPSTVVEAWLLEATIALDEGERPVARHALRAALDHADRLGTVRPFALAPLGVRAMLVDMLGGVDDRSVFAARALAAHRPGGTTVTGMLTLREQDVLARLPSLSNLVEIADDLDVSVNTIKSHVRAIYDKLGASSRRTAVLAAHERGLLN